MQQRSFAERFLKHLDKIDPAEIESFILRTVRERDFTARIFETLAEGIVVFDASSQISMVNTAARRILRWPFRRRLTGEHLVDQLPPGPLKEEVEAFILDPVPVRDREILLRPRARKIFNIHLLPIGDPEGGAALILQDLTPARARQERDAEARKIASLATLTAGVAHDIKNPLNSLSIHAQLLDRAMADFAGAPEGRKAPGAERVAKSCAVIGEEVERLRKCVDDFIDAARPRKPTLRMNDLNRVVDSVARMAREEFEVLGIRIETFLDSDLPALRLDESQMQRALRNLVRNAVEAIQRARRAPEDRRIVLRTTVVEDTALLEVSDSGCGVAKEDTPRIFEPYFTTKFNGSGLGLMAVGRIVREHGAEISVQTTEGEGTVFAIEFPIVNRRVKLLESK